MKVLHAPQHMSQNLRSNLETILELGPVVALLTEQDAGTHDNVSKIRRIVGHKYHVCVAPQNHGRSREIVVLLKKAPWRKLQSVRAEQVSDFIPADGPNKGIGADRWIIKVRWKTRFTRFKYAFVGTHWNAVIQGDTGFFLNNKRADVMERIAAPALQQTLRELVGENRRVVGSADFNFRKKGLSHRETWSPENVFRRLNFSYFTKALDWLWASSDQEIVSTDVILPGERGNGSDHPWIMAVVRRLKRRK